MQILQNVFSFVSRLILISSFELSNRHIVICQSKKYLHTFGPLLFLTYQHTPLSHLQFSEISYLLHLYLFCQDPISDFMISMMPIELRVSALGTPVSYCEGRTCSKSDTGQISAKLSPIIFKIAQFVYVCNALVRSVFCTLGKYYK